MLSCPEMPFKHQSNPKFKSVVEYSVEYSNGFGFNVKLNLQMTYNYLH